MSAHHDEFRHEDWASRYRDGETPWDLGEPHPELSRRLQEGTLAPPRPGARVLVPGAGNGHDALALARRGWAVVAVDVVPEVGEALAPALERSGGRFVVGDALAHEDDPFDLVWDHTFFCAIPRAARPAWGERAAALLAPGGLYAALVFPHGKPEEEGGPPHGMSGDHLAEVLGARLEVLEDTKALRRVAARRWGERFFLARRRPLGLTPPA
ncbi:MAG: methyltransferase domain-containing protein [Planctomycetota bacterium]|jgi:SAM-dependent methyltransferase